MTANLPDEHRRRIERFQTAFNEIEAHLRFQLRKEETEPFTRLLGEYGAQNPVWQGQFGQDLSDFARLRNALAHQSRQGVRYLSVPVSDVVERIEYLREQLINEERVIPAFQRNVVTVAADQTLSDVMHLISANDFSQFPVYKNGAYLGLLTENGIARWLAKHITQILSLVDFEDVRAEILLSAEERRQNAIFVSRDETVQRVTNQFGRNPFLEAALITHRGKAEEKLMGIVTRWDVIRTIS